MWFISKQNQIGTIFLKKAEIYYKKQQYSQAIDYSNKAEERLTCDYQGDDMQIGFNARFLVEMLNNLDCTEIKLSMSLPNRAGILTPMDGVEAGEKITMLVMPVMLND